MENSGGGGGIGTSPTKLATSSSIDQQLIQFVQEAIHHIKSQKQQCNVKSIFAYLRQNHNDYGRVATLTERELMNQLDTAVKDGILSRKFGGGSGSSNPTSQSNSNTSNSSPIKLQASSSSKGRTSVGMELRLPTLEHPLSDKDKKDINPILQVLMKTVATLTKLNFAHIKNQCKSPPDTTTTTNDPSLETTATTRSDICSSLLQAHKFYTEPESSQEIVGQQLSKVVAYLINKHDKIFLKESIVESTNSSNEPPDFMVRLNSVYIQEKLHQNTLNTNRVKSTTSPVKEKKGYS